MKYTKGEWSISNRTPTVVISNGKSICSTGFYHVDENCEETMIENEANAKLISSAPDLLRALQIAHANLKALAIEKWGEHWVTVNKYEPVYRAEAAILKATGGN